MPIPPETTPLPPLPIMAQSSIIPPRDHDPSTASKMPEPTPLPPFFKPSSKPSITSPSGPHNTQFKLPKLRLELRDLSHPGTKIFLTNCNASTCLEKAVQTVLSLLYQSPSTHNTHVPPTRSVTLILRSLEGVAYTTGTELDNDHKEIHMSLEYINGIAAERKAHEIEGVVTHELVHCLQYNGRGKAPGGLIEGIADWVRLKAGLGPPYWNSVKRGEGKWDAGYERTAFFLSYLGARYGGDVVRRINEKLRTDEYKEKQFWSELLGRKVEDLWEDYRKSIGTESRGGKVGPQKPLAS